MYDKVSIPCMPWEDPCIFAPVFSDHQIPCASSMIDQCLKSGEPKKKE